MDPFHSALRQFPWCVPAWAETLKLLDRVAEQPATGDRVFEAIRDLLTERQDDMMYFLSIAVPRDTHAEYWAYPDVASWKGTPLSESEAEREQRQQRAHVGKNPLQHILDGLGTQVEALFLARHVAESVLERARCTSEETAAEAEAAPMSVGDAQKSALRRYGAKAAAFICNASSGETPGIGVSELSKKLGISESHLKSNVLRPLRNFGIIDYDDGSHCWMTPARLEGVKKARFPKVPPE